MGRNCRFAVLGLALLTAGSLACAETVSVLMEEGLYSEQTVGDPAAAAEIYRKILAHPDAGDDHKAQAQFRLGMCYLKLRDSAKAVEAFEAVISEYPGTEAAAQASGRLARLVAPNPAALMPPETVIYIEVGSPGNQVEQIVEMLSGTPLANPLEMLGATTQPGAGSGRGANRSAAGVIRALLNPSMIEEFKKIRGMAVGFMDIPVGRQAPFVAALYPGESDALRGIITAALLVGGEAVEPIHGMQTLRIRDAAGVYACYDDNVILLAVTTEQLDWSVRQYKGLSEEPSLATDNRSFMALTDKESRRTDALTIWANPAKVYESFQEVFLASGARRLPAEFQIADVLLDFEGIEGIVGRLVIDQNDPYVEALVAFKPGHQCLAYDMIRTPPLSDTGFAAVPADAVGVISVAMAEAGPDGQQVSTVRQAVERLTGLDIGREIFANIEQINLFALPVSAEGDDSLLARGTSPIVPRLAMSVTSRNPEKTNELLDRLLRLSRTFADIEAGRQMQPEQELAGGQYLLLTEGADAIYCYTGQAGRANVLALAPDVRDSAIAAGGAEPGDEGPARFSLAVLDVPENASKLAYVNVSGAIRAFEAHMKADGKLAAPEGEPSGLSQLADLFEGASVQFYTVEEPNLLKAKLGIRNLPPLGDAFDLVVKASRQLAPRRRRMQSRGSSDLNALAPIPPAQRKPNVRKLWTFEPSEDDFYATFQSGRLARGFAYTGDSCMQAATVSGRDYDVLARTGWRSHGHCLIPANGYFNIACYSKEPTSVRFALESAEQVSAAMTVELKAGRWQYFSIPIAEFERAENVLGKLLAEVSVKGGEPGTGQVIFIDDMSISDGPLESSRASMKTILDLPGEKFQIPAKEGEVVVDGVLDEWSGAPIECVQPAQILKIASTWKGPADCSFRFWTGYDDQYLYVAVSVTDDKLHPRPGDDAWRQEAVEVYLDARTSLDAIGVSTEDPDDFIKVLVSPVDDTYFPDALAGLGARAAFTTTESGYDVEIAIPVAYIESVQGAPWRGVRLNVNVVDFDGGRPGEVNRYGSKLYWRQDWRKTRGGKVPTAWEATFVRAETSEPAGETDADTQESPPQAAPTDERENE